MFLEGLFGFIADVLFGVGVLFTIMWMLGWSLATPSFWVVLTVFVAWVAAQILTTHFGAMRWMRDE